MMTGIPKLGKHISISGIVEKYKVIGSIARMLLKELVANGTLKCIESHSKQAIYTPTVVPVEKAAVTTEKEAGKKGGKKK